MQKLKSVFVHPMKAIDLLRERPRRKRPPLIIGGLIATRQGYF
jgi:hypothetical protein